MHEEQPPMHAELAAGGLSEGVKRLYGWLVENCDLEAVAFVSHFLPYLHVKRIVVYRHVSVCILKYRIVLSCIAHVSVCILKYHIVF